MLEQYFEINVQEIQEGDIEKLNNLPYGQYILERTNEDATYLSSFQTRHNFTRPGISDANVVSLFYTMIVNKEADLDFNKLCDILSEYFSCDFGEKNYLYGSCDKEEDKWIFYFLLYPLPKRTLDPRQWTFKGKMLPLKEQKFFSFIETKFELKEEEKEEDKFITEDPRALEDMQEREYVTMLGASSQTDTPYEDIMNVFKTTYRYFSTIEKHSFDDARRHLLEPKKFLQMVEDYLRRTYTFLTNKDIKFLLEEMYNAVYDYHVLTPLINDPNIGDIKILKTGNIRLKVKGERMTSNLKFDSREDYENFIQGIAFRHNINLANSKNAMSHFVDVDGNPNYLLRFNISTPYVASNSISYTHIRKISKTKPTINQLIADGMLSKDLALWFIKQVKESTGIIFVGQGGSGKTTLMNVLLEYIPYTRSAMVIQDNEELFTDKHPDIMFLHTVEVTGDNEGEATFDLKDISKNGLLVDIDYFIIGEIKGAEAMYFLNASATGARCWASLHSSYPRLDKLADYVMYESKYDKKQALMMLQNLEYVVYMDHYKVKEIAKIKPWNDKIENLEYEQIYHYKTGLRKE